MEVIQYGKYRGEDTVILKGLFGSNLPSAVIGASSSKTIKAIFTELYSDRIVFLKWFTLEAYELLLSILNDVNSPAFNKKLLNQFILQLKQERYLKYIKHTGMTQFDIDEAMASSKHILNYSNIKRKMNFGILGFQQPIFDDYSYMKYVGLLRGWVMAAEPGTGKTFSSLALSEALEVDRVIIIAPRGTLDSVWVDSLTRSGMYKKPQEYWTTIDKEKFNNQKFIIIHYEFMTKLLDMLPKDKAKTMIIIDESQNINEKGTTRDKALTKMLDVIDPEDVVLLSGTPIKGKSLEVSNLLKLTDKRFTPMIEERFETLYKTTSESRLAMLTWRYDSINTFVSKGEMKVDDSTTLMEVVKLPNAKYYTIDEIKKRMRKYGEDQAKLYESKKEEYLKEYVELRDIGIEQGLIDGITTQTIVDDYLKNIEIIRERYSENALSDIPKIIREANKFEKDVLDKYTGDKLKWFRDLTTLIKYPSLKIQGEILARIVMRTRIDLAKDFAKHLDYKKFLNMTTKKTLTFSSYGEVCEEAYMAMSKHTEPLRIYWEWTADIYGVVKDFSEKDKHQALIVTYKSVSAGIPILAANLTIFYDLPFKSFTYGQAIARTDRNGQDSPCTFVQLLLDTGSEKNINSRNVDIISMSKDMVEEITNVNSGLEFKRLDDGTMDGVEAIKEDDSEFINFMDDESMKEKIELFDWN